MLKSLSLAFIAVAFMASTPVLASETRCGWFSNPTPGNAWLDDKDGQWTIATQGDTSSEEVGDWPEFKDKDWVETNGHYGYGCACMTVDSDPKTMQLQKIYKAKAKPLSACRKDKALKEPKE